MELVVASAKTAFGLFFLAPYTIVAEGFVLSKLWLWFLVPLGIPAITLWQGSGMIILGGLFIANTRMVKEEYCLSYGHRVFIKLILPWFILLCGWVVKSIGG